MVRITDTTPAKDGYSMPAEFGRHDGTIMIYPTRPGSWGKDRTEALRAFGQVFLEILKRENLYLLTDWEHYDEADKFIDQLIEGQKDEELLSERSYILPIDSDDAWARDVGPTFVTKKGRDIRAVNWKFNAWGGEVDGLYAAWDKDDAVAEEFCDLFEVDIYDAAPFVLEGGSIHSDGEGTVMVTESCLLSAGRNPQLTKEQIEEKLNQSVVV